MEGLCRAVHGPLGGSRPPNSSPSSKGRRLQNIPRCEGFYMFKVPVIPTSRPFRFVSATTRPRTRRASPPASRVAVGRGSSLNVSKSCHGLPSTADSAISDHVCVFIPQRLPMISLTPIGFLIVQVMWLPRSHCHCCSYRRAVKPGDQSLIAAGSWCPGKNELATIRYVRHRLLGVTTP